MFCQIFLSPQVKQCAIITYKHKLAHQLPNKLTLRKYQESMKPHRIIAQRPAPRQKKTATSTSKNPPKTEINPPPRPKTKASPKYPANDRRPHHKMQRKLHSAAPTTSYNHGQKIPDKLLSPCKVGHHGKS